MERGRTTARSRYRAGNGRRSARAWRAGNRHGLAVRAAGDAAVAGAGLGVRCGIPDPACVAPVAWTANTGACRPSAARMGIARPALRLAARLAPCGRSPRQRADRHADPGGLAEAGHRDAAGDPGAAAARTDRTDPGARTGASRAPGSPCQPVPGDAGNPVLLPSGGALDFARRAQRTRAVL